MDSPIPPIPGSWRSVLGVERERPYFRKLRSFLDHEERRHTVLPPREDRFRALALTPYHRVRVLILGQDPYPTPGHAHGLAFSVPPGIDPPPSLRNILREREDDLGLPPPGHGHLAPWARRGALLLNAVLTVRAGQANAHRGAGWAPFTDAVIRAVARREERVVFLLWGRSAQKKRGLIDADRHAVIEAPHPSPLSAYRGFFGSRPFSRTDAALREAGREPIDWTLPAWD